MDLTISIDDELFERAHRLARRRGTSLQELLREQLRLLASEHRGDAGPRQQSIVGLPPLSGGRRVRRWRRDEIYDEMYGGAGTGDAGSGDAPRSTLAIDASIAKPGCSRGGGG